MADLGYTVDSTKCTTNLSASSRSAGAALREAGMRDLPELRNGVVESLRSVHDGMDDAQLPLERQRRCGMFVLEHIRFRSSTDTV